MFLPIQGDRWSMKILSSPNYSMILWFCVTDYDSNQQRKYQILYPRVRTIGIPRILNHAESCIGKYKISIETLSQVDCSNRASFSICPKVVFSIRPYSSFFSCICKLQLARFIAPTKIENMFEEPFNYLHVALDRNWITVFYHKHVTCQ